MNALLKYFIAAAGIVLAILGIVFGALLPLEKSTLYVQAINKYSQIKTLADFEKNFNSPLNYYSPIGQEETVRFLATDVMERMISPQQNEAVARQLVAYIEPRILTNDSKQLLIMASIYAQMFQSYGREEYLLKTEEYFKQILSLNPKSPQALNALLSIYIKKGELDKAKKIGETILKYWPEDNRVKELIKP